MISFLGFRFLGYFNSVLKHLDVTFEFGLELCGVQVIEAIRANQMQSLEVTLQRLQEQVWFAWGPNKALKQNPKLSAVTPRSA